MPVFGSPYDFFIFRHKTTKSLYYHIFCTNISMVFVLRFSLNTTFLAPDISGSGQPIQNLVVQETDHYRICFLNQRFCLRCTVELKKSEFAKVLTSDDKLHSRCDGSFHSEESQFTDNFSQNKFWMDPIIKIETFIAFLLLLLAVSLNSLTQWVRCDIPKLLREAPFTSVSAQKPDGRKCLSVRVRKVIHFCLR